LAFSIDPVMSLPLKSLKAGMFCPLCLFYILVELYLCSAIRIIKMSPGHFVWQSATAWIDPLDGALLISSYYMLYFPLPSVVSFPCCNIQDPDFFSRFYEEQNIQYSQTLFPCNSSTFSLHSYHLLPIARIFPIRRFASLNICFVEYTNHPFRLWLLASFTLFYFQ